MFDYSAMDISAFSAAHGMDVGIHRRTIAVLSRTPISTLLSLVFPRLRGSLVWRTFCNVELEEPYTLCILEWD